MRHLRFFSLMVVTLVMALLMISLSIPFTATAQDQDIGTPPAVLTPGVPVGIQSGTIQPTLTFDTCYEAFPLLPGDLIYIEPGVNIRAGADGSTALVWNTSFNQVDEDGNRLPPDEVFNLEAFVVEGPVCSNGYNWWRVDLPIGSNDGWVSEGRPTDVGGYLIRVPGIDLNFDCVAAFDLVTGDVATVTQNVRVRTEPNSGGRVQTVAPAGSEVQVLAGPECDVRTGVVWFQVSVVVLDVQYVGWMAQGTGGAVWLLPNDLPSEAAGTLCGTPLGFSTGDLGYINSFDEGARYLRAGPGLDNGILFLLVDGVPFEIIGGPTCVNNLNWWNIRVASSFPVEGWVAEGSQGVGYWLSPIDPDEYAR